MRFELIFGLEKEIIPIDYRSGILSYFKSTFEKSDETLYSSIYEKGVEKNITFSVFFKVKEFKKDCIILKDKDIKIVYSVEDTLLAIKIFNAFLDNLHQSYPFYKENKIKLMKIVKKDEEKIEGDEVIFKLLSPMIIREKLDEKKSWYYELDKKGIEVWKKNIKHSLSKKFPERYLEELEIEGISTKKTVIKFYKINMVGTLGVIKVKGKKEILNFLYKSGVSTSRKSFGFGMVDIIKDE